MEFLRKTGRLAINAGVALLAMLIVFALAEITLRLIPERATETAPPPDGSRRTIKCDHDALLGWIFPPRSQGEFESDLHPTPVETNSLGVRGPESDLGDSARLTILVLGDSYAFGWGVEEREGFPRQIERLSEERGGRSVRVINGGIPGYGVHQQARMLAHVRSRTRVDVVVSTVSLANDPIDDLRIARYLPDRLADYSHECIDPRSAAARVIRGSRILSLLDGRTQATQFHLMNASPMAAAELDRSLRGLAASCREAGVPVLLAVAPRRSEIASASHLRRRVARWFTGSARATVLRVARDNGIPVVDLTETLCAVERGEAAYLESDAHWTPAANRAVAAAIVGALADAGMIEPARSP